MAKIINGTPIIIPMIVSEKIMPTISNKIPKISTMMPLILFINEKTVNMV